MLNLLILSPYPAMRAGLRVLLENTRPVRGTVVGEADSVEAALGWMRTAPVDVAILDLALDDDQLSVCWQLRTQARVPILALADSLTEAKVLAALQAGVQGCVAKTITGEDLLEAALRVSGGDTVLPPTATRALLARLRGDGDDPLAVTLSAREVEVLRGVAAGQTNKAIALKLNISEHTVKFHLGAAMSKLGAASRAEAVASALRRGLIPV